jgi:hypothetical protein
MPPSAAAGRIPAVRRAASHAIARWWPAVTGGERPPDLLADPARALAKGVGALARYAAEPLAARQCDAVLAAKPPAGPAVPTGTR